MANNQYPNPPKPYTLTEIAQKIRADCDHAKFIYDQICTARAGGQQGAAAAAVVDANFKPDPTELDKLGIPQSLQSQYARCTDPKTRLILFAC
jgi:hypothetical protein